MMNAQPERTERLYVTWRTASFPLIAKLDALEVAPSGIWAARTI